MTTPSFNMEEAMVELTKEMSNLVGISIEGNACMVSLANSITVVPLRNVASLDMECMSVICVGLNLAPLVQHSWYRCLHPQKNQKTERDYLFSISINAFVLYF